MKCLEKGVLQRMAVAVCFLLIVSLQLMAQNRTVTGKVTNVAGDPLSDASVTVVGTTIGTSAGTDGSFTISVPPNGSIKISAVGYAEQEIKITNQPTVAVKLQPMNNQLDQVVVVGYGTQKKKDVTGAVTSVNETALREVPVANLQGALQGRAAGLEVQRSGTKPGAGAVIRIRGERSITGSNDPLIVLDGIPFEGGNLNDINPDDVASVDILKDASATAIYGSRGSNGVILVTTKRGRSGDTRVSYNGYYGISSVRTRYDVYDVQQYRDVRERSTYTGGYMPEEQVSIATGRETNWQDLMYENGFMTDHNISVSGGANGNSFSLGGGFFKETAVLPGQDFSRYNLKATIDSRVGKRVRVGLNSLNTLSITNGSQFVDPMFPILSLSPLMPAYDSVGNIVISPTGNTDDRVTQYSPLFLKENNHNWVDRIRRFRSFNSAFVEVQIIEGLKYRLNAGLDFRQQESAQFKSSDLATNPSYFRPKQGNTASVDNILGWGYTLENVLTYDKTFAQKHRVNFTGLFSVQEDQTHNTYVSKDSIDENFVEFYNLGQANASNNVKPVVSGSESSFALLSYMARINYAFDDRYLVTLTGRIDGSSRLAPGNKFQKYPAISIGWNITNEDFMQNVELFSNLKLRAGLGQTSNQSINPYSSLGLVSSSNGLGGTGGNIRYNFGPTIVTGYNISALPNSSLDWEYTNTLNIGVDFGLFENRITGSIEWYNAKTSKILYGITLPTTSGIVGNYLTNIGEMRNKGFEISISSNNIKSGGGFTWNTDLNIFLNRNELLKLTDGFTQNIASQLFIGQPLSAIYDYEKLGIWQESEAAEAATFGNKPGDIKLRDISGPDGKPDGKINPNHDRFVIGNSQADWQGGMTNRFTYKGFDASFVIYARFGGLLVSQVHQSFSSYLTVLDGRRNGFKVNYWTPQNGSNDFPSPESYGRARPIGTDWTTVGYYDASFVKLRSVNIGYTLPSHLLKKITAQSLRVYITAQNPWVIYSPYMSQAGGVDPEPTGLGSQGVQNPGNISTRALTIAPSTPPTKSFLVGINISF